MRFYVQSDRTISKQESASRGPSNSMLWMVERLNRREIEPDVALDRGDWHSGWRGNEPEREFVPESRDERELDYRWYSIKTEILLSSRKGSFHRIRRDAGIETFSLAGEKSSIPTANAKSLKGVRPFQNSSLKRRKRNRLSKANKYLSTQATLSAGYWTLLYFSKWPRKRRLPLRLPALATRHPTPPGATSEGGPTSRPTKTFNEKPLLGQWTRKSTRQNSDSPSPSRHRFRSPTNRTMMASHFPWNKPRTILLAPRQHNCRRRWLTPRFCRSHISSFHRSSRRHLPSPFTP